MPDVSNALLLPDVQVPDDGLLKTLAIYWDNLVVPDYTERAVGPGVSEFSEPTDAFLTLEEAGVISKWKRAIDLPITDPTDLPVELQLDRDDFNGEHGRPDQDEIARVLKWIALPIMDSLPELHDLDQDEVGKYVKEHPDEATTAVRNMFKSMAQYAAEHYLGRMQDAFELSNDHRLAPVARSPISHVASIIGAPTGAPRSEAAILSAAVQAFELDPATPVDEIVRFREKNQASLGRFRASLVDLSEGLRQEDSPTQLLASARDTYRNRVVPALGDLEAVLKEGQIRFFVKSLLGATAIAMAPVDPVRAVEGGATILGQTLNYSFSREKLIREHPFGYLHQVSSGLSATQAAPSVTNLAVTMANPVERIQEMLTEDSMPASALGKFFFSGKSDKAAD